MLKNKSYSDTDVLQPIKHGGPTLTLNFQDFLKEMINIFFCQTNYPSEPGTEITKRKYISAFSRR